MKTSNAVILSIVSILSLPFVRAESIWSPLAPLMQLLPAWHDAQAQLVFDSIILAIILISSLSAAAKKANMNKAIPITLGIALTIPTVMWLQQRGVSIFYSGWSAVMAVLVFTFAVGPYFKSLLGNVFGDRRYKTQWVVALSAAFSIPASALGAFAYNVASAPEPVQQIAGIAGWVPMILLISASSLIFTGTSGAKSQMLGDQASNLFSSANKKSNSDIKSESSMSDRISKLEKIIEQETGTQEQEETEGIRTDKKEYDQGVKIEDQLSNSIASLDAYAKRIQEYKDYQEDGNTLPEEYLEAIHQAAEQFGSFISSLKEELEEIKQQELQGEKHAFNDESYAQLEKHLSQFIDAEAELAKSLAQTKKLFTNLESMEQTVVKNQLGESGTVNKVTQRLLNNITRYRAFEKYLVNQYKKDTGKIAEIQTIISQNKKHQNALLKKTEGCKTFHTRIQESYTKIKELLQKITSDIQQSQQRLIQAFDTLDTKENKKIIETLKQDKTAIKALDEEMRKRAGERQKYLEFLKEDLVELEAIKKDLPNMLSALRESDQEIKQLSALITLQEAIITGIDSYVINAKTAKQLQTAKQDFIQYVSTKTKSLSTLLSNQMRSYFNNLESSVIQAVDNYLQEIQKENEKSKKALDEDTP